MLHNLYHVNRLVIILPAVIPPIASYLFSLKRTPYRAIYATMISLVLIGQVLTGVSLHASSVTVPGAYAAVLGVGSIALIPVVCTELMMHEKNSNAIIKWRNEHPVKLPRFRDPNRKWKIKAIHVNNSWESPTVEVRIVKGDQIRIIGRADPVTEMEEYIDLKVRAQDVADTYNREGL